MDVEKKIIQIFTKFHEFKISSATHTHTHRHNMIINLGANCVVTTTTVAGHIRHTDFICASSHEHLKRCLVPGNR